MSEFHEPASWPKVVGTISIVLASLGLACNSCGMLGKVFSGMMMGMAPPEKRAEIEAQQLHAFDPWPIEYALMGVRMLLACWLLAAGITLVRRRASGRPMHLIYAVASLLFTAAGVAIFTVKYPYIMKDLQTSSNPAAKHITPMWVVGGTVGFMVFLAIWPTFCLIWFGAVKRDARDLVPLTEEPLV